jgi:putative oxidoreductase
MGKFMQKLLRIEINEEHLNLILLFIRVSAAALMLTHGYPKLTKLFAGGEIEFADPIFLGPAISLVLAVFAEFFCSILIAIGLGTRLASIPLIITMGIAVLIVHASDPIGGKEKALLFLIIYLTLLVSGSGKYSVDYILTKRDNDAESVV